MHTVKYFLSILTATHMCSTNNFLNVPMSTELHNIQWILNMPPPQYANCSTCQILKMPNPQHAKSSTCQLLNMPTSTHSGNIWQFAKTNIMLHCTVTQITGFLWQNNGAQVLTPTSHTTETKKRWASVCWLFPCWQGFRENVRPFMFHCCFFFFFKVEISLLTLIAIFRPGSVHSGSVTWDDCGWEFADKFCVSSYLDGFPHSAWTAS